jgi:ribokinase
MRRSSTPAGNWVVTSRRLVRWRSDLLDDGPDLVAVAVGAHGNLLCRQDGEVVVPLVGEDAAVDSTGGGDAFVATLTWALLRGEAPERIARLARAAAGLTLRYPGGRPSLTAAEIEATADRLAHLR